MHLRNNTLLAGGKYRISRFIASGGFGCTYEAHHVQLEQIEKKQRRVAIKEFFVSDFCNRNNATNMVEVATDSKVDLVEKLKAKFKAEAQSLMGLEHPSIVSVYDVFEQNGTVYYVMNYIDGESLASYVKRNGPLSEPDAVQIMQYLCDALAYVHAHGLLHLDIKPENVMIDRDGNITLIDFGVSKQYDEAGGANTSTILGMTPGYAAPEQMAHDASLLSPATDVYSLGATMYFLLTGHTPPSASTLASGAQGLMLPDGTSPFVVQSIFTAMNLMVPYRQQSADQFAMGLSGGGEEGGPVYYGGGGGGAGGGGGSSIPPAGAWQPPLAPPAASKGDNTKMLVGIIIALAIIAAIILILFFMSRPKKSEQSAPAPEVEEVIEISSSPRVTYSPAKRLFKCPDVGAEMKMLPIPGYSGAYIASTECPQWLYKAVTGSNPSAFQSPAYPVTNVSWYDCSTFAEKLSALTGKRFVLPTSAQWTSAASDGCIYSGSNTLSAVGWYNGNSAGTIHPCGQLQANAIGAYDMSGNVFEWVREKRGRSGSYKFGPSYATVSYVNTGSQPQYGWEDLGFRIAME